MMERRVEPDLREGFEKTRESLSFISFFFLVPADLLSLNRTVLLIRTEQKTHISIRLQRVWQNGRPAGGKTTMVVELHTTMSRNIMTYFPLTLNTNGHYISALSGITHVIWWLVVKHKGYLVQVRANSVYDTHSNVFPCQVLAKSSEQKEGKKKRLKSS